MNAWYIRAWACYARDLSKILLRLERQDPALSLRIRGIGGVWGGWRRTATAGNWVLPPNDKTAAEVVTLLPECHLDPDMRRMLARFNGSVELESIPCVESPRYDA